MATATTKIRAEISRSIDASPTLRNKKDLIEAFVDSLSVDGAVDAEWQTFITTRRDLGWARSSPTKDCAQTKRAHLLSAFRDGSLTTTGTAITTVLPPASRFTPEGGHGETKQRVIDRLSAFFERFQGSSPLPLRNSSSLARAPQRLYVAGTHAVRKALTPSPRQAL